MDREVFAKGMALLISTFDKRIGDEMMEAYELVLSDLTDEEWQRGVMESLKSDSMFPRPATLRAYARPQHVTASVAAVVYAEILDEYEKGNAVGPREIREHAGRAAVEAFIAAGGPSAFQWCEPRNAPFRMKAFIEAFEKCVADDPSSGLGLPPAEIDAAFGLPPGEALALEKVVPSTLGHKVIRRAPAPGDTPSLPRKTLVPPPREERTSEMLTRLRESEASAKPITDTDERRAELARQAKLMADGRAAEEERTRYREPPPNPPYGKSSGFTVIEALIVISILGICLAIAIPSCLRTKSEGVSMPPTPSEAPITPNVWLDIQRKATVNGRTIYAACDTQTKNLLYVVSYSGMNGNASDAIAVVRDGCNELR